MVPEGKEAHLVQVHSNGSTSTNRREMTLNTSTGGLTHDGGESLLCLDKAMRKKFEVTLAKLKFDVEVARA